MKRIFASLCGLGSLISLVVAGSEDFDGSCSLLWTVSFLALSVLLGWAYVKLTKRSSHV